VHCKTLLLALAVVGWGLAIMMYLYTR